MQQKAQTVEKKLDPRAQRTRQVLHETLLNLLHGAEFSSISVQDITEKAGINRATFYAHYEDKFDLLSDVTRNLYILALDEKLGKGWELDANNLQTLILITYEFLAKFHGNCHPIRRTFQPPPEIYIQNSLYDILLKHLKTFHPSPEPAASLMSWAIFGSAFEWARMKKRPSAQNMTNQIFPLIRTIYQQHAQVS